MREYGVSGIFFARLLPVVRHLISIPAGILRMPVAAFSAATTAGAFLWCLTLAWFGKKIIGDEPTLLDSPEALMTVLKHKMHFIVLGIVLLAAAYAAMIHFRKRSAQGLEVSSGKIRSRCSRRPGRADRSSIPRCSRNDASSACISLAGRTPNLRPMRLLSTARTWCVFAGSAGRLRATACGHRDFMRTDFPVSPTRTARPSGSA